MKIGLCMVVKDEARQLRACLDPIIDLFDQAVIVDTGSTDGTRQLLRERYGIQPVDAALQARRCFCLQDPRIQGLDRLSTPWVMFLDADERIDPAVLNKLLALPDEPPLSGYFGRWLNHPAGETDFDDYKLFLFRRGLQPMGLVHDNVQMSIRQQGLRAAWLDALVVQHFPDPRRRSHKKAFYRQRLDCAIGQQPGFLRYHWFRGYMEFLAGDLAAAERDLKTAALAASAEFPVECLNSAMVLAQVYAGQGREQALARLLEHAGVFYASVVDDFEVRVNFGLAAWLQQALVSCREGQLSRIVAPRFAC